MQRVSMPSDLAATSPLLLQLLIPQGFTLQSRSAQTQSQTQAPWLQLGTPCSLACLSPRSRTCRPAMFPYSSPWLQEQPPPPPPHTHLTFFPFLITTNSPCEKPNSGTAEPALCPGSYHSVRDASMLRSLHM